LDLAEKEKSAVSERGEESMRVRGAGSVEGGERQRAGQAGGF